MDQVSPEIQAKLQTLARRKVLLLLIQEEITAVSAQFSEKIKQLEQEYLQTQGAKSHLRSQAENELKQLQETMINLRQKAREVMYE